MTTSYSLSGYIGEPICDPYFYKSIVSDLQYITITKPNLSYVVNKIFQFMENPFVPHWRIIERIKHLKFCLNSYPAQSLLIEILTSNAKWIEVPTLSQSYMQKAQGGYGNARV